MAKTWGDWENVIALGEGGQAHTFLVRKRGGGQETFVLKRLKNGARLARFRAEVDAGLTLAVPNIVRVLDRQVDDGADSWFVTGYCSRGELSEDGCRPLTLDQKLELFSGVCAGVAHAHEHGIVHRDLKPQNIFLRADGTPVVGDFGLCHFTEDGERFTFTAEAIGSRWYMAPELEDGRAENVTPRADVYSLGKVLYWLFAARIFAREKHHSADYFLADQLPGSAGYLLYEVLDRSIVSAPRDRFASASELLAATQTLQRRLKMGAHAIGKNIPQPCSYCGVGQYLALVDSTSQHYSSIEDGGDEISSLLGIAFECGNQPLAVGRGIFRRTTWTAKM